MLLGNHDSHGGTLLPEVPFQLKAFNRSPWIEQCSYPLAETGVVVTEPCAQLAVIYRNDARIYQVRVGV